MSGFTFKVPNITPQQPRTFEIDNNIDQPTKPQYSDETIANSIIANVADKGLAYAKNAGANFAFNIGIDADSPKLTKPATDTFNYDADTYNLPDLYRPEGQNIYTSVNMFGLPFIGAVTFCAGGQPSMNSNNLNGPLYMLPEIRIDTCLITCDNNRKIVETSMLGRTGTIKTFINSGDLDITLEMIVFATDYMNNPDQPYDFRGSYNGVYPYELVQNLNKIFDASTFVKITNTHLNLAMGVEYVVITDIQYPQEEGSYSEQKIIVKCKSDDPNSYKSIISYTNGNQ